MIQKLYWTLTNEPYWKEAYKIGLLGSHDFTWATEFGFKVKYKISCIFHKVDLDQYKAGRMLEPGEVDRLVVAWHDTVVVPKFRELGCSFRFLIGPNWEGPQLCRPYLENGRHYFGFDSNCREIMEASAKVPFQQNGCIVKLAHMEIVEDPDVIAENYDMIKLPLRNQIEQTPEFRRYEESVVADFVFRRFQLEKEFLSVLANQQHKSKLLAVSTRLAGQAVEITWRTGYPDGAEVVLRGYRTEQGFMGKEMNSGNGDCVVQTRNNDKAVHHLEAGKEYFYTFVLSEKHPVHGEAKFPQAIFSSPPVIRMEEHVLDSLRFSIRVPTQRELLRVEQMLARLNQPPPVDPRRAKIENALGELNSFVELDEALSQWERQMIRQYSRSSYSESEKADKIERLQLAVSTLRLQD